VSTQPPKDQDDGLRAAVARKGSFLGTMRAVAWSFLGIRKGKGYEQDEPAESGVVIAGVIGAVIFVLPIVLVNWMVGSGVAS
jgi:hypothetical protein